MSKMSGAKIRRNAVANITGMAVQIIIAFILSPFLVHTLGDTKYGIWTIAVAFTGYMNLLDIGLTSAVNKYVSEYSSLKDNKKVNEIVSTSFALFFVMGVIVVLVSPFMADFIVKLVNFDESLIGVVHLLIIIVSFDIAIFVISGLFKGVFGGFQHYSIINFTQIISALYKAVMFYYFLSNGHDLIAMGLISISANIMTIFIFYYLLKRNYPQVSIRFSVATKLSASKILHYSKFTFIAMLANQLIYYSDAFVIGYFMSAAAVTYYSIPWTLAEYTKKISMAISQAYTPAISEIEAKGDIENIKTLYVSGTKYMIIISNLLSIGMIVFGGAFIALWMGEKYKELCETVLIILFVNLFFQGPQQISYSILQGLARQKYYSYVSMGVSIVNLILSIILVQRWGIVGVAIGAAVPQILFHGLYVPWSTLKIINLSISEYFTKTYLPSVFPSVVLFTSLYFVTVYVYPDSYFKLLVLAFLCALVYMIFVFVFMLNKDEKSMSINFLRKRLKLPV